MREDIRESKLVEPIREKSVEPQENFYRNIQLIMNIHMKASIVLHLCLSLQMVLQ